NRRLLVLLLGRFGMMPPLGLFRALVTLSAFGAFTAFVTFRPFPAFSLLRVLNVLGLFAVFCVFGMLLGRMLHRFGRGFGCCIRVFGIRRRGRIAGRGQGTTVLAVTAAAGMASASASGSTPATRCCRIRLLG